MNMQVSGKDWNTAEADWLIVPITEASEWPGTIKAIDETLNGLLSRMKERGDLTGKLGEICKVMDVPQIAAKRLLCLGLGPTDKRNAAKFNQALMTCARAISDKPDRTVSVLLPEVWTENLSETKMLEIAARAFTVGCVGQGIYQKEAARHEFALVEFLRAETPENQEALQRGQIVGNGINLTRELVNLAPDDMFPKRFAKRAGKLAEELELECEVFDESRLKSERMGSMLAVAKGRRGLRGWWC